MPVRTCLLHTTFPIASWPLLLCLIALVGSPAAAQTATDGRAQAAQKNGVGAAKKGKWVRLVRDAEGQPLAMETAVVRYRPKEGEGPTIDLIAAVHIGDRSYYDELNEEFEQYDALLYELVTKEKGDIPRAGKRGSGSFIGAMQNGMKSLLELEHQLERIDYSAENFVHADMTAEEFQKTMSDRGESFFQMFLRVLAHSAKQQAQGQNATSDVDLLFALFNKDRARRLKIIMAEQFQDMEAMMVGWSGPGGSTIINERNRVAFEVLREQVEAGHKNLGVFYGAGHLADMDQRLREDFGLAPVETRWIPAWNLAPKAK